MTVITTFSEKKREKRWKFERKVLRELSLRDLRAHVEQHFSTVFPKHFVTDSFLMDPCIDMAIDAYLLGAEYSRLGYYGERMEEVKSKCEEDLAEMEQELLEILELWAVPPMNQKSAVKAISRFIHFWWEKGFLEGKKKYQLRLQ